MTLRVENGAGIGSPKRNSKKFAISAQRFNA